MSHNYVIIINPGEKVRCFGISGQVAEGKPAVASFISFNGGLEFIHLSEIPC